MKYALIGCGRISPNHIEAAKNNNLEFVAMCDIVPEVMQEKSDKFGLEKVRKYTDYKELLGKEKPELVAIATESGKHAAIALDCIAADCNVIIEKPIALSIADADAIVRAGKEAGVVVCANHQNRFNKSVQYIRKALEKGCHVMCESPIVINPEQLSELRQLAKAHVCQLFDSLKTAYAMAYSRLVLLAKSGAIGQVMSVDATCTSMTNLEMSDDRDMKYLWNSIAAWGPTALLPIFQLLGTNYNSKMITTHLMEGTSDFDTFTKIAFVYPHAVASLKVGQGVKSEGELVISGTKGYIYVPAPWWKTDYFEVRYENPADNRRYFYQLDGEGIRYMLVVFKRAIQTGTATTYVDEQASAAFVDIISDFYNKKDTITI